MKRHVVGERHLSLLDFLADLLEHVLEAIGLVFAPSREVQMGASLVHIMGHEPGRRSDLRVPGPLGAVTMAVGAAPLEDGGHVGR